MTKRSPFDWPPRLTLLFTNKRGELYFETTNRFLDLSDSLMSRAVRRTVYMTMSTNSDTWAYWDEANVAEIERRIKYDLNFDDYGVNVQRVSEVGRGRTPCAQRFTWKLRIWTR